MVAARMEGRHLWEKDLNSEKKEWGVNIQPALLPRKCFFQGLFISQLEKIIGFHQGESFPE